MHGGVQCDYDSSESDREIIDEINHFSELMNVRDLVSYRLDGTDFRRNTPSKSLQEYYASSLGNPLLRADLDKESIKKLFHWDYNPVHDKDNKIVDTELKFSEDIKKLMRKISDNFETLRSSGFYMDASYAYHTAIFWMKTLITEFQTQREFEKKFEKNSPFFPEEWNGVKYSLYGFYWKGSMEELKEVHAQREKDRSLALKLTRERLQNEVNEICYKHLVLRDECDEDNQYKKFENSVDMDCKDFTLRGQRKKPNAQKHNLDRQRKHNRKLPESEASQVRTVVRQTKPKSKTSLRTKQLKAKESLMQM